MSKLGNTATNVQNSVICHNSAKCNTWTKSLFSQPTGGENVAPNLRVSLTQIFSSGFKQLSPCLSGVSRPAANVYQLMARLSPITLCIIQ